MLAIEGNEVAAKDHVRAHKNGHSRADLDGHGAIVGGTQAERCHAIRRILIRKLQNTEQGRAIAPQCKLLFTDGDLVLTQYLVQSIDELDVRYGLEGTCRVWRFHQSQLFPGDEISVDVGQKLAVLHLFSPCDSFGSESELGWKALKAGGAYASSSSFLNLSCARAHSFSPMSVRIPR